MTHPQRIYLTDILDRIRRIEEYAAVEREEFIDSELREDGVVRCFEVIGEIVKRLDPTLTAQYPDIPWKDFAGTRDFLIHRYDEVLAEKLWDYIQEDIPPLKAAAQALLKAMDSQ
jgi:uncharacterized protein with HEPN domain